MHNKVFTKLSVFIVGAAMAFGLGATLDGGYAKAYATDISGTADLRSASYNTNSENWDVSNASGFYSNSNGVKMDNNGEYIFKNSLFTIPSGYMAVQLSVTVTGKINGTAKNNNQFEVAAINSLGDSIASCVLTGGATLYDSEFVDQTFTITEPMIGITGLKVCYKNKAGGNWGVRTVSYTLTYTEAGDLFTVRVLPGEGSGEAIVLNDYIGEYFLPECTFTAPAGKKFHHWLIGSTSYNPGDRIVVSTSDVDITAIYKNYYTISYDGNGATSGSTDSVEAFEGSEIKLSNNGFEKTSYVFKEWNTQANGEGTTYSQQELIGPINSNLTFYAIWYRLSTLENPYTILEARKAYDDNIKRNGQYVFGLIYTYSHPYSYYDITISIDGTGETSTIRAVNCKNIGNVAFADYSEIPALYSEVIIYGNLRKDGDDYTIENGYLVDVKNPMIYISFDANGGSGEMATFSYRIGEENTHLPANTFTAPEGKEFARWDAYGPFMYGVEPHCFADGDDTLGMTGGSYIFRAVWGERFDVTFYYARTVGYDNIMYVSVVEDGYLTLPNNPLVIPGKTFVGWTPSSYDTDENTSYEAALAYAPGVTIIYSKSRERNMKFYDIRKPNIVLTLNGNNELGEDDVELASVSGKPLVLPENTFTAPVGKVFDGWNTSAEGTGITYNPNETVKPTEDTTFYAKWADAATVTYYPNGASGDVLVKSTKSGVEDAVIVASPFAKDGYRFEGWNTKEDGTGTVYKEGDIINSHTGNLNLYAIWHYDYNSVSFGANGSNTGALSATNAAANATQLGLNSKEWEIVAKQNEASTPITVYAEEMRFYTKKYVTNGCELVVRNLNPTIEIVNIKITANYTSNIAVRAMKKDGTLVSVSKADKYGYYPINAPVVSIQNVAEPNTRVDIQRIMVEYKVSDSYFEAKNFENDYVKRGIDYQKGPTGVEGTACLSTEQGGLGYFDEAMDAYDSLSADAKIWFATLDDFAEARERLIAWAAANGRTISFDVNNGSVINNARSLTANHALINNSLIIVISIFSVSIVAIGILAVKKKRQINR